MTTLRYYLLQGILTVAAVLTVSLIHISGAYAQSACVGPWVMTMTEGTAVGFAILGTWAAAWGIRMLVITVRHG